MKLWQRKQQEFASVAFMDIFSQISFFLHFYGKNFAYTLHRSLNRRLL